MYSKECYQRHKAKRIQKSLAYYYERRNNPEFMEKRRESDRNYYRKSKPCSKSCLQIEKGILITFD